MHIEVTNNDKIIALTLNHCSGFFVWKGRYILILNLCLPLGGNIYIHYFMEVGLHNLCAIIPQAYLLC